MPSRLRDGRAVVRLSPVSMTTRMPSADERLKRIRCRCLHRIGDGDDAGELAVDGEEDGGGAVLAQSLGLAAQACRVAILSSPRNLALPSASRVPSTMPMTPLPVGDIEALHGRELDLAFAPPRQRSPPPTDARWRVQRWPPKRSDLRFVEAVRGHDRHDFRLAFGQRAGLVDDQRVDLLHALQRLGILDQHAGLRAAADADHDRHRRRQAQRAGAGDDQHAHRRDQAVGEARLRPERRPGGKGNQRAPDHRRHEPAGRPDRPAAGSARALRCAWPPSARSAPASVSRADLVGAHHEAAALVERAADDALRPVSLVTGINSPVTIDSSSDERPSSTTPSTGTLSPGRTRKRSPTCDSIERHFFVAAVLPDAARGLRREIEQRADRAGGRARARAVPAPGRAAPER